MNLRGGLYVGQRGLRSQGTLLLPPSLESLRIGGSLEAGNGVPSSSGVLALIDFGENSALTNWSVGGNFTIGCGYHAVVTNLPENVTFQVGSRDNPSSMLIAHGGRYHGVCELTLNHGVFDAFLEELKIGGHYSSSATDSKGTLGALDLGTSVVQFNGLTNGVHLPRLWLSRSRNHRPGILRLPSSVTNITIGECVIGASRDYGELDLGAHSELQTFTVTNGFYLAADIDGLNPANTQTCNDGRIVGWPTNVDVTIGQPEAPCPLFIGITRQYGTGAANRMILTNGSFTAWVSDLALGIEKRDGYGSGITGVLDLRETELRQLDISGHAFVGCWTNEVVGYQNNYRGHGELRLPAGDVRVGGDLRVGDAHSTSSGLVEMLGSRMSVGGVAEINATGLIEVRLDGASAGLNLLNPAENVLTIADGGELQLRFENAPAVLEDHFWGLRMIGDRQQQLTEMAADGRLTWINNLEDTERVLGIHYDVSRDLTIVGLHRPVGTMILLR